MTEDAQYLRPTSLAAALDALASQEFSVAAGCTDLFPATEHKVLQGAVLDITAISELRGIALSAEGLRIGATTTWTDIIRADLPAACAGLQLAAREVGAIQIQNRGTIAGNLCNASPAADGVPPLLTLDTQVELGSTKGTRRLPLQDFITGPRQTVLEPTEMITALHIPAASLAGRGHFLKLGARKYLVISIAMTAARIVMRDGVVSEAALAIGSCGPVATRLPGIEDALLGRPLDPLRVTNALVAKAINPIGDMRADAAYRNVSSTELMQRTLHGLAAMQVAA